MSVLFLNRDRPKYGNFNDCSCVNDTAIVWNNSSVIAPLISNETSDGNDDKLCTNSRQKDY